MAIGKKWKTREQIKGSLEEQLLFARGIKTDEDKKKFLNPDYERDLHDPFLILDMDKAVERILTAIKNNEKVVIYGDYDADGVCSSVVLHDFFKKIGFENFEVYIPDRYKEGYGMNLKCLAEFKKNKVDLIITVDCGITEYDEVRKANEYGIDVVITDHHLQGKKLPFAKAIVDPKREDDNYPYIMLCGAAVAFKLVKALIKKGDFKITPGWSKWLLDVVCIATIADMVPLDGENRVIAYYGLKVLRKTNRPGLLMLFDNLKMKKENINEDDIGFMIAPRINIAGRMEHANISFNLLTAKNNEEAKWAVKRLNQKIKERKNIVDKILNDIQSEVKSHKEIAEYICLGDKEWQSGVLPIVANRLLDAYNKPVFIWGQGEGNFIKGSARTNGMVDVVDVMKKVDDGFFVDYGGHSFSGGFTIAVEKENEIEEQFKRAFKKAEKTKIEDVILYDKKVDINDVNWKFFETVDKFSPFGKENEKPVFMFEDVTLAKVKTFGNGGIHLQFNFKINGGEISAIGFFMVNDNDKKLNIKSGDKIDLLATIEKSMFRGFKELRLRIIDYNVK
ncbi:single-stranded-DNA-specific exonuclease RecJ [Patescibacteria group bacterium]